MSIIGSSWKDEETPEEKFEQITGYKLSSDEIPKEIDKRLESNWISRSERQELKDLQNSMRNPYNEE